MATAATAPKADDAADVPLDPNTIVELNLLCPANAGFAPATHWGKVAFDAEGKGTVKLPLKDIALFSQLKWMLPEDLEKYLGISQQVAAVVTTADNNELQSKLDATTAANVRLAQKNAELEAKLDEIMSRYQKEMKAYDDKVMSDMKTLNDSIDKLHADNAALSSENESLKAQLAAAQPAAPAATTEATTKPDATAAPSKAKKDEKKDK